MKNLIRTIIALFVFTFTFTTVNAQVSYNSDISVDFTQFKTYGFGGWQENSEKLVSDIDKNRLYKAFENEFNSRGMTFKEGGGTDIVVTFYFVIDQKTSRSAYTSFNGGMGMGYGYGMGYHRPDWGWGMGSSTTTYSENDYEVGTFIVDVYNTKSKKLIWQGVSKGTIKEKAHKREKSIPKGAAKIMKKYPVKPIK